MVGQMINKRRRSRLVSIFLISQLWILPLISYAEEPTTSTVWNNSYHIFHATLRSPLEGSFASYSAALGFAGLTYWALQHDINWFYSIQANRNAFQDKFIPPINLLGDGLVHVGAYAALYKYGNSYDRQVVSMAIAGQVNVAFFSVLIKALTSSPRPSIGKQQRDFFTFDLGHNSFASGHTMTAFCAAAIFGHAYHCEWLTFPLAALVGYARIYERRHWPADVMAGAGLGLLIGYTVVAFYQQEIDPQQPGIRFALQPDQDGGRMVLSWQF